MTREELEQILALPGTSIPKQAVYGFGMGPTSALKGDRGSYYDPRRPAIMAQEQQQQPVEDQTQAMASLGMDPNGNPLADAGTPLSPLAANTPDNLQITPAGGPVDNSIEQAALRAPEYFGTDFIASGAGDPQAELGRSSAREGSGEPKSFGEAWDRFMSRPGTGTALMKAGAAIMGGRTPLEGLGAGVNAFSGHFEDERLREQQRQDEYNKLVLQAQLKGSRGETNKTQQGIETRLAYGKQMGLEGQELQRYALGMPSSKTAGPMKLKDSMSMLNDIDSVTGSLSKVNEIESLLTSVAGVAEGGLAPVEAALAKYFPDLGIAEAFGGSTERGLNTLRWENIMSQEAITTMANTLKGATTNFELEEFKKILADKTAPNELKFAVIQDIKAGLQRKAKILNILSDPYASEEQKVAAFNEMRQNMATEMNRPDGELGYRQRWEQARGGRTSSSPTPATNTGQGYDYSAADALVN